MYENSIICFTSDHGDMLGDHHHWRKTYAYEGSANVPCLFKWPDGYEGKTERGTKLENPVELRDFLPTFLDAAGAVIPGDIDGKSLLGLVKDPGSDWRSHIDLEHATCYKDENYWCALTDGTWKYIWFFRTGEEQLFHLKQDPGEEVELSEDGRYRDTLAGWRDKMIDHLKERGEGFVKNHQLVIREETMLYGPNYPEDERTKQELMSDWKELYKGFGNTD
jgi:arylsulfatase A-like enzyme